MAEWTPSGNAYPVRWLLRNGRWGVIYGTVEAVEVRVDGRQKIRYELRTAQGELVGTFPTGDEAANAGWHRYLGESGERHRLAATRQHER